MILSNVVTMAAGEVREMACGGNYFELRTAAGLVSLIELLDRSGGVVSLLTDAEATDYVRTSRNFEQVRITNGATAQAVKFYYGDGDSGSNRFTGVISGSVALDAPTLAALEYVQVRPEAPNGYYNNTGIVAAGSTQTAVMPAANANGLIVSSAYINDFCSTYGGQFWLHDAAAPSGSVPATAGVILQANVNAVNSYANLAKEVFIPAGRGLYFYSVVTSNGAAAYRGASWRAL